ncbi:MAG: hypothetical protein QOJ63_3154 [Solirubrobacteraceae bacterium]|jgi:hypothetical protein|nr:hypothetical protein [Solirubrobacteraceae bacterium]
MTVVAVLQELWSRRLLVVVGLAIAVTIGILVTFKVGPGLSFDARQYKVGVASAGVLVDSPSSQVIDLGGGQSKADIVSLSARARLLANLMATSPLKDQIARRAGVAPDALIASAPTEGIAAKPSPLVAGTSKVRASDPDARVLTVYVNEALPIITADAQAPSPAAAAAIAAAAVTELNLYLTSTAAADRVPDARRLVVKPLGPAKSATVQRGPRKLYAIIAFIVVLGLWCAGIMLASSLARSWRATSDAEALAPDARPTPPSQWPPAGVASDVPRGPHAAGYPRDVLAEPPEQPGRSFGVG